MDATDILGGLFGRKRRGGSSDGPDLGDIFGRGRHSGGRRGTDDSSPEAIDQQAEDLEDLLNVSNNREQHRRSGQPPQSAPPQYSPRTRTVPPPTTSGGIAVDSPYVREQQKSPGNAQALVLVRAMINAAKADGEISRDEQQSIINHFDGAPDEAMQFLRQEISQPLNVREFAWSVPLGMEQQVYAMSLLAIQEDTPAEQQYLDQLAHGLRLSAEVCQKLHARYGGESRR